MDFKAEDSIEMAQGDKKITMEERNTLRTMENPNEICNKHKATSDEMRNNLEEDSGRGSSGAEAPKIRHQQQRVKINVGGQIHETYKTTLKNIPDTRLSWITETTAQVDYDPENEEYFFDRHPAVFAAVLNYYRTGKLHAPLDVCGPLYEEELGYWGIDDDQVESCCWLTYRQHRDAQETLKAFEGIEFQIDFEDDDTFNMIEEEVNEGAGCWERWQPKIWSLMDDPQSSKIAKIIGYMSLIFIIISVLIVCLESLEYFAQDERYIALLIIEGICVAWFTVELTIRLIFCPEKKAFIKNMMNWIDFLAIVPFYISLAFSSRNTSRQSSDGNTQVEILLVLRLIRIFRIFKLSRHSTDLQILGHTLKASIRELVLLVFFLLIGVVIFSSLIYYCEKDVENTKFTSIPAAAWWAIVTMTTVGYGDIVPVTIPGKIVGSFCAVSGVLMIALPVPVIVNNFSLYYSHAQARLKLPKKRRRVLVNADNALKTDLVFNDRGSIAPGNRNASLKPETADNQHCSIAITDETNNSLPRRLSRRESHLFGAASDTATTSNHPPGLTMSKRRSLMPRVAVLPEVE